ncbi:unnamed protein product [Nippostrongylus brasiliensis]|uniref:Neuropeptide F n=1 Tax=Nippostrongylus brasiliensis TaxID=27835 RepID=A0A0N4XRY5_NIPBR|nr:unnamed protein product [Nippostrongylus brasiliensis]
MWLLLQLLMWSTVRAEDMAFLPLNREFLDRLRNDTYYNRYATPTQYDGKSSDSSSGTRVGHGGAEQGR